MHSDLESFHEITHPLYSQSDYTRSSTYFKESFIVDTLTFDAIKVILEKKKEATTKLLDKSIAYPIHISFPCFCGGGGDCPLFNSRRSVVKRSLPARCGILLSEL